MQYHPSMALKSRHCTHNLQLQTKKTGNCTFHVQGYHMAWAAFLGLQGVAQWDDIARCSTGDDGLLCIGASWEQNFEGVSCSGSNKEWTQPCHTEAFQR
jgi:hypothetical protein